MPTIYLKLKLTQNDTDCVKGEELDSAVENEVEGLVIDGYDLTATVSREKQAKFLPEVPDMLRAVGNSLNASTSPHWEANTRFLNRIADIIEGVR